MTEVFFSLLQTIQQHGAVPGEVVSPGRLLLPKPLYSGLLRLHTLFVLSQLYSGRGGPARGCSSRVGGRPHASPRQPYPHPGLSGGLEK